MVSKGCEHCYAMGVSHRFPKIYPGLTKLTPTGPKWTGKVMTVPDLLDKPLRWKKPRRIFVNSMSDLFHKDVPHEFILDVFDVMEMAKQHTFLILTKRPERMFDFMVGLSGAGASAPPLSNVWLGVSVENQPTADERIPILLRTPAAVRWVSAEPLLGPVDFRELGPVDDFHIDAFDTPDPSCSLHWVVAGGESGTGARPMHPNWAKSIRDQCQEAGVPFLFKQWGAWHPSIEPRGTDWVILEEDGTTHNPKDIGMIDAQRHASMCRVGKKAAGRELDGRAWDQYPGVP